MNIIEEMNIEEMKENLAAEHLKKKLNHNNQPGGFMGIKPTTTAQIIDEQIAKNDIIIEQAVRIDKLESQIQYINALLQLLDDNEW